MSTGGRSDGLVLDDVAFAYRRGIPALDGLTITLNARLTCVLGPNGAGKSTFFGVATGRLLPQQGKVAMGQLTLTRRTRRDWARRIGWTPQDVPAAPGLTVREQVRYVAWLHGLSRAATREAADEALEAVDLTRLANARVSSLSGGQRRRVGIASGISHRPAFAFLDEPTAGLDAEQRDHFRSLLRTAAEHTRIVVSTHQTEDVSEVYDDIMVIDSGRALFQGTVGAFIAPRSSGPARHRSVDEAYIDLIRSQR